MEAQVHSATAASDIVVELRGVCKTFRQKQRSERLRDTVRSMFRPPIREVRALQQIDLQIRRGEIVAYAGPNGAGKSTTVKLLSGMLAPDMGTVRSLGMDPVRERVRYVGKIGVVFGQRTELWMDHPIAASFEWKRVVWDIPRPRYERMRDLVKELLGMGEFFNSLTRELSLGQKMRAELGLALLHGRRPGQGAPGGCDLSSPAWRAEAQRYQRRVSRVPLTAQPWTSPLRRSTSSRSLTT